MTNLCYFNQDNAPISQHSECRLHQYSLLVALKRASLFGDEMRMQTWRRTEILQMLGVTTIGSHIHVGSQALGEDRHRLVDVFSWQLFPNGLQGDFQLISRLMLRLEFMVLFQHGKNMHSLLKYQQKSQGGTFLCSPCRHC